METYFDLFQIVALTVVVFGVVWAVSLLAYALHHSLQALVSGLKQIPITPRRRGRR